jgi:hypothetical protein
MIRLDPKLLALLCCLGFAATGHAAEARYDSPDYSLPPIFSDPEPQPLGSAPPQPYEPAMPENFVVISEPHDFANSRVPVLADQQLRVFIRTYDRQRGVYVDSEVPDPTCMLTCRRREAQLNP